ncbi:MAG: glycosyltransferase family 4 protein [Chlorobi bacterium]|nr:glycosyltransferase family 4 protein [Chlorobiota bacterium]
MKKILFISFYWPPSGKASIHWPLKMIKHLPEFGWEPSVLTVKEDTFTASDSALAKETPEDLKVWRTAFWDPFVFYKKFLGKKESETLVASEALTQTDKNLKQRISIWIRMNLFIPDARMGWLIPGFREAKKIFKKEKFDAILTNGPPHTTHILGKMLSEKFDVPLVSVFIDPWVDIAYYKNQKRNPMTLKIDNMLEKSALQKSSQAIFVTEEMKKYFEEKYPFIKGKTNLLYWGYSEEDFENADCEKEERDYKILLHAGNIFDYQNPEKLWRTIKELNDKGEKIKLRFVGTVGPAIKNAVAEAGLSGVTEYLGFLLYPEVLKQMCGADYLLVCATEPRHVPGKLFEYMRTGNPIIAFGDGNDEVKEILQKTNSGFLYRYDDAANDFFAKAEKLKTDLNAVKKFDRKVITEKLAEILNKV